MPLIACSNYTPPSWLVGCHLQTIYPALFRRVPLVTRRTERLELANGDFLDLAWSEPLHSKLAILSHGLEGTYEASYIQGMAKKLIQSGWDVLAWNLLGCGSEPNRLPAFYHSGKTEDLRAVIEHAIQCYTEKPISLIGFSLGGNLTLKYIGERSELIHPQIQRAIAFSAPCDLSSASEKLAEKQSSIYMARFMTTLRAKVKEKQKRFPCQFDLSGIDSMKTFAEFDERFTAPLHGFTSAQDYWNKSSSRPLLPKIRIPTLLISALNDPFLGKSCYPTQEAQESEFFHLETPQHGGHIGFYSQLGYWSETRAIHFLSKPGVIL